MKVREEDWDSTPEIVAGTRVLVAKAGGEMQGNADAEIHELSCEGVI